MHIVILLVMMIMMMGMIFFVGVYTHHWFSKYVLTLTQRISNQTRLKESVQCIICDCCEDDAFVAVFLAVTVMQMMMPIEIPKRPESSRYHHHRSQKMRRTGLTTNSTFIQERQKYVRIRDLADESVRILKYVCFFGCDCQCYCCGTLVDDDGNGSGSR